MVVAVRLGLMPRSWLQEAVPPHVTLKNHPHRCDHQNIKRHGNAHGRFALCQDCGMKWKWDNNLEKWVDFHGSRSSSTRLLPLPSPSSIATPYHQAKAAAKPKIKAMAKSRAVLEMEELYQPITEASIPQTGLAAQLEPSAKKMLLSILNHSYFDLVPTMTEEEVRQMRQDMIDNMDAYVIENQQDIQRVMETSRRTAEVFGNRNRQSQVPHFPINTEEDEEAYDWGLVEDWEATWRRRCRTWRRRTWSTKHFQQCIRDHLHALMSLRSSVVRPSSPSDAASLVWMPWSLSTSNMEINMTWRMKRSGKGHQEVQALVGDSWSGLQVLESVQHQHELLPTTWTTSKSSRRGETVGPVCMWVSWPSIVPQQILPHWESLTFSILVFEGSDWVIPTPRRLDPVSRHRCVRSSSEWPWHHQDHGISGQHTRSWGRHRSEVESRWTISTTTNRRSLDTSQSQEYPDELVDTILIFMKKIIHRLEPHRFALHHVLPVAQPVADLTEWDDVVQHVSKTFERANKRPFNIDPSSDLGKKICDLARMNAVRIQCAYTPTTRRIPTALAFDSEVTSRAALLEYANGRRVLEVDNILELQLPKQRFDTPVAVAIFMYGTLREEPPTRPTATDEDAKLPLADLPTDITFPGLPSGHGINVDTRRTVARLHLNLGHPSPQELIRMVAYYGGAPSAIITCIQHLKCSTCERLKSPQQPRPATMPKFIAGQFGDEVQGDLFYVRLLTGDAIPVLGLVDKATGYHQAAVCTTRNSAETFEIFVKCWFKPFGLPYKMMLDPDTAFRGDCQRQIESLGIICDFCPAEAHWMIGMVERRNSILRCILEKLIDQHAASTTDELELLLAPALHAVNSSTFTRGRTAFQAVFGRVPRLPGGLLTDETSLASSHGALDQPDNLLAKAEIIRSEAQKYLMDLNINQQLGRAILRRTRNTKYVDLSPGQPCAFWRWQKKGQRKRGGWIVAKFLSWDPSAPSKLAWLRTGNSTTLVAAEQIRAAMGFENWHPSEQDIRALKDAEKSFQEHLLEDDVGPALPEDATEGDMIPMLEDVPILTAPATPAAAPLQLPLPSQQPSIQQTTTHIQQITHEHHQHNIHSPTYQQTQVYQRYGPPPKTPSRHRGRSRSPKPPAPSVAQQASLPEATEQQVSQHAEQSTQPLEQQGGEETQQPAATPQHEAQQQPEQQQQTTIATAAEVITIPDDNDVEEVSHGTLPKQTVSQGILPTQQAASSDRPSQQQEVGMETTALPQKRTLVRPTLDMVTFQMATSEPMQLQNKESWIWKAHTKPWMRWILQMIPVMMTNHHLHLQLPLLPINLHFNLQLHRHLPHLHLHYHHISGWLEKKPNSLTESFLGERFVVCQKPTFRNSWKPLRRKQTRGQSGDPSSPWLQQRRQRWELILLWGRGFCGAVRLTEISTVAKASWSPNVGSWP